MLNLSDNNLSYIIINNNDEAKNILIGKGYTIYPINRYNSFLNELSYIAISNFDDNILREDSNYLVNKILNNIIIKYNNEGQIYKKDKIKEYKQRIEYYPENINNTYVINGISFKFEPIKEYKSISSKSELQSGMTIEYYNKNKWVEKIVENVDIEYENIYKLMIKHNKLRKIKED